VGRGHIAQQIERLAKLLNSLLRVAVEQGDLAKRVAERRERLRLAARAGDARQRIGAGSRVSISMCRREEADRPAQRRYGVVAVFDLLPTAEDEAAALRGRVVGTVELVEERQAPGGKQLHRRQLDLPAQRGRFEQERLSAASLAALRI